MLIQALSLCGALWLGGPSTHTGVASWYGPGFYGHRTASGEVFRRGGPYTAAHKTLPFGTKVLIINLRNNKYVYAVINDRGPFIKGRDIDLSKSAAERLGMVESGTDKVQITII